MATLTVTATQTGTATKNGTGIAVRVVTGALAPASQNGVTASGNTTTLNATVTPHAAGSQIYTAIVSYASGSGSFTWEPGETGILSQADPTNVQVAGFAALTSVTPNTNPVLIGAASGPGANYHFAAAEILGTTATSLAEDPTTPAPVYNSAGIAATSPLFSPPSGALLVALVATNTTASGTQGITISDTLGLTWTQLVINPGGFPNTGIWVAQAPLTTTAAVVQQVTGGVVNSYGIGTTAITSTAGNALVVFAGWETPSSSVPFPALAISDSAGNLWKQLDISIGSSSPSSTVRTRGAIWIAANAQPVSWVSVSTTGVTLAAGWLIAEISGLAENIVLDFAVANSTAAPNTSITGVGSAQGVGFALIAGDTNGLTVTSGPAGWTALTRTTQGNATDGVSVMPYWNSAVAAGSNTLSFTFNTSDDFSVLYCQILSAASPPPQFSTQFPFTMVEAAFGAQPGLVNSSTEFTYSSEQIVWQDISSRVIGGPIEGRMAATRGKQYELSQAESGTLEITLDNHDGAFTPTYPGSPYYSNAINSNMSFQAGLTDWLGYAGASLSISGAFVFASGLNAVSTQSLLFTGNGTTSNPGIFENTAIPVNQNYKYSCSFWVYSPQGWASGILCQVNWLDRNKNSLGQVSGSIIAVPVGAWTQVTFLNLTPLAGTMFVNFGPQVNGTPASSVQFYIAEAAFVQGTKAVQTGLVALLTPIRVTTWWNGVQYPVWMGYVEQWPQAWPELPQWGFSKVIAVDAVGVISGITMSSALVSDILIDNPYTYLPCNEQYTTATVGTTPNFQFLFGSNPYYAPADANGLNALNKAPGNQITGVYSDGHSNVQANTGVAMNFLGDNSTGVGATSFSSPITGHRGPCVIYSDPALAALTTVGSTFTIEFWFTWTNAINTSLNLFSAYGVPSSFWFNGANTYNGNTLMVWIKAAGASNNLIVTLNQTNITGPVITPSAVPQQVVLTFSSAGIIFYVNGAFFSNPVIVPVGINATAVGLGTATYSYDCNNSALISNYTSNNYAAGHLVIYSYALPAGRVSSHYQAGATGYSGVSAAFRFAQIISWALAGLKRGGYYILNATGTAEATQVGPAYSLSGSSAAAGINSVAQSEGGQFYVKADGTATYLERQFFYNQPNFATFGDNATSATAPLNTNPGFSNGITGWIPENGTLTSSGTAYAGNGSGLFTPTGGFGTATAFTGTFGVSPASLYDGGAWVLNPIGYGSMRTTFTWLNASGGTVSASNSPVIAVPANSWSFLHLQGTAPAGAVTGKYGVQEISSPILSNTFYVAYGAAALHSTEVPFLRETEFGFDNTYLYNEVTSTQQAGPSQTITADYRDTTSQGQYFRRSALSFQQSVVSPYDVSDITTWSETQYKQPSLHLNQLKVLASANPLVSFPVVLSTDIGDIVTVTRRPVGGATMTIQGIVERVSVEIGSRFWMVTYQISPYAPQGNVLSADTAGFNTPATTTLGW